MCFRCPAPVLPWIILSLLVSRRNPSLMTLQSAISSNSCRFKPTPRITSRWSSRRWRGNWLWLKLPRRSRLLRYRPCWIRSSSTSVISRNSTSACRRVTLWPRIRLCLFRGMLRKVGSWLGVCRRRTSLCVNRSGGCRRRRSRSRKGRRRTRRRSGGWSRRSVGCKKNRENSKAFYQ